MSYTTDVATAADGPFRDKVKMAMVKAALAIISEARTVRNAVDDKRNSLARQVLNDPTSFQDRFVNGAIEAGALTTLSTDAQIDTGISSTWNGIAGVTTEDLA